MLKKEQEKEENSSSVLVVDKRVDKLFIPNRAAVRVVKLKRKIGKQAFAFLLDFLPNLQRIEVCEGVYKQISQRIWNALREFVEIKVIKCVRGRPIRKDWKVLATKPFSAAGVPKSTYYYWKNKLRKITQTTTSD